MLTNIKELDRLLGYRHAAQSSREDSIPLGSVVILRGEPGSGKTTLALQIVNQYLENKRRKAAFVSLETSPEAVVDRAAKNFNFTQLRRERTTDRVERLAEVNREDIEGATKAVKWKAGDPSALSKALLKLIEERLDPTANIPHGRVSQVLIVIDSLLLLADVVSHASEEPDMREIVRLIRKGLQPALRRAIILFTAEHHQQGTIFGESFCADIEIVLSPEPIAGPASLPRSSICPVGYSVERNQITDLFSTSPQAVVTRAFCRVLKNRFLPNHSRRCAYDIVDNKGLSFYETFPGDGQLVMFAENTPQRQHWQDFVNNEVPYRYPAIRFTTFDRIGLQRTFASQRILQHMPDRTDLYLSSFDTYWVNWYVEYYQRSALHLIVREHVENIRAFAHPDEINKTVAFLHAQWLSVCGRIGKRAHIAELPPEHEEQTVHDLQAFLAKLNLQLSKTDKESLRDCVRRAFRYLTQSESRKGVFEPIKAEHIRLFGEHNSPLLKSLNKSYVTQKRPIHFLGQDEQKGLLISVPYDANVGLFVFRRDLVETDKPLEAPFRNTFTALLEHHHRCLKAFVESPEFKASLGAEPEYLPKLWEEIERIRQKELLLTDKMLDVPIRVGKFTSGSDGSAGGINESKLTTWEEIIAWCHVTKHQCIIETETFDSFVAFFMELLWNCGGDFVVTPAYQIENKGTTAIKMFRALFLLRTMFSANIIRQDASVEPAYIQRHYAAESPNRVVPNLRTDWGCGRFWYSTLVDVLTRKEGGHFVWRQPTAKLEITPVPVSIGYIAQQSQGGNASIAHHSCWGEWHFGVLRGSENRSLAQDLINNLMGSRKICERAFECAALPTVERFYALYKERRAICISEREPNTLPSFTFGEFYSKIFPSAKSRCQIFDYRHCMQQIHGLLEMVRTLGVAKDSNPLEEDMRLFGLKILETLSEIEGLGSKGLMRV